MRTSPASNKQRDRNIFSFFYEERFEIIPDRPILTTVKPKRSALGAWGEIGVGNDLLRYRRSLRPRQLARLTLSPEFTA